MKNRSAKRIWLGFISAIILIIVIGGTGAGALTNVAKKEQDLLNDEVQKVLIAHEIAEKQQEIISNDRGYLHLKNISFLKNKRDLSKRIDDQFKILEENTADKSLNALIQDIQEARSNYTAKMDHSIGDSNNGDFDNSLRLAKEASEYAVVFGQKMNELIDAQNKELKKVQQSNEKSIQLMKYLILGFTLVAIIVCIFAARSSSKR